MIAYSPVVLHFAKYFFKEFKILLFLWFKILQLHAFKAKMLTLMAMKFYLGAIYNFIQISATQIKIKISFAILSVIHHSILKTKIYLCLTWIMRNRSPFFGWTYRVFYLIDIYLIFAKTMKVKTSLKNMFWKKDISTYLKVID